VKYPRIIGATPRERKTGNDKGHLDDNFLSSQSWNRGRFGQKVGLCTRGESLLLWGGGKKGSKSLKDEGR